MLIDAELVFAAKRMITGANVHHVNTLIFHYEQAVQLHNRKHPTFRVYPPQYEEQLRQFVLRRKRCGRLPVLC
jgi:hypothetical protein